ncbi:hypothetical protein [Tropicibacter sp. S64]|uniref:hypothetical protein n=1 Tax=Tropicibacter sp. S64 TaxID=3415122 RepID=UPI003C7BAAE3
MRFSLPPDLSGLISGLTVFLLSAAPAGSQTLLAGPHSISGPLCVGNLCTGSEAFSGDVDLLVKEYDPRLRFEDTSTTFGTPTTDWELRANDLGVGGEYFAVVNADTDTPVFRLDRDAPANALYVANNGKVGLGTAIPLADLQIESALSPSIRLNQNGSGGAPAGFYDLQYNNQGFDLVGSSGNQPFSVLNNALTGAVYVNPNGLILNSQQTSAFELDVRSVTYQTAFFVDGGSGNVSVGMASPQASLHVQRSDGSARVLVENTTASAAAAREMFTMRNNGGSYFTLENTATNRQWYFVHEHNPAGRFFINHSDGGRQMALTRTGDMTISGQLFTGGSCAAGCDRVFDSDYPLPSLAEQMAAIREKGHLPNVGPTEEDGPFNLSAMSTGMLNELEKAYLYIDRLQTAHDAQKAEIDALRAEVRALAKRMAGSAEDGGSGAEIARGKK